MDDADLTSEDEEDAEGEGETEGDEMEDEMTDVWFLSGFSAPLNHLTCFFVDLFDVLLTPVTGPNIQSCWETSITLTVAVQSSGCYNLNIKAYAKY